MKNKVLLSVLFLSFAISAIAQETKSGINPNSVYPIHDSDIMYQKRIWRRVNLLEKQNQPFMAVSREITRFIFDQVAAGTLPIYTNDSLTTIRSKEDWLKQLEMGGGSGGFDDGWGDEASAVSSEPLYYTFKDTYILEIQEDLIFDKKRSRMYYDIQSIKVVVPGEKTEGGVEKYPGTFKYKDLEKLFRNMPNEAVWFNPQNSRGHLNLADAFNLRLFASKVVKIANPGDDQIIDVYEKRAPYASEWLEHQLMEYEHELWEF